MFQLLKRSSEHMVNFVPPVPGSNLNNDDLTQLFQCSPQGGVQAMLGHACLDHSKPYLTVDMQAVRRAFELALA